MDTEKIMQLADRIDHEQLWRRAGIDHKHFTPEQRDRYEAGVQLRRYANLLGSNDWRIYPPHPPVVYRASTLDAVVKMARDGEARRAESGGEA